MNDGVHTGVIFFRILILSRVTHHSRSPSHLLAKCNNNTCSAGYKIDSLFTLKNLQPRTELRLGLQIIYKVYKYLKYKDRSELLFKN